MFISQFTSELKHLSHQPEVLSLELNTLSDFLLQRTPKWSPIDDWCRVSDKNFKLTLETVKSMQAGELDYLYPHIEHHLGLTSYDNGLAFFEGHANSKGGKTSKQKMCPETQSLYRQVKSCLLKNNHHDPTPVPFLHYPGAGVSTIAHGVLWYLKNEVCCIVPSQI